MSGYQPTRQERRGRPHRYAKNADRRPFTGTEMRAVLPPDYRSPLHQEQVARSLAGQGRWYPGLVRARTAKGRPLP